MVELRVEPYDPDLSLRWEVADLMANVNPARTHHHLNVFEVPLASVAPLLAADMSGDMRSNWKWYTVFCGWDPGVYGTWYECYKQGINFDRFYYAHFDTKEEAIADFDRYNHAATIAREVHDQLTLEEALAELDEIPPPPLPLRMWIEELYKAKGAPLPRSPSFDEEPRIDLFPRDRTLYQRVGSGYEYVMDPWWSD
ncbi:hypothetical protein Syun_018654 [Stephania yunnanensis]|uniref:Ribonuclease H1 N-terminal domain-containing protein n=1 Tax=Stephania yunnanensis TaxID=152371 RepID=A0AAP0IUK0_9MAGN